MTAVPPGAVIAAELAIGNARAAGQLGSRALAEAALEAAARLIVTDAQKQFAAAAREELAKPLADLGAKIATEATATERARIRQLATEYRAVYFSGNRKDGIEPSPFADLIGEEL